MEKSKKDREVVNFLRDGLEKRNYHSFYDPDYTHHGEVVLRELQEDLSSLEMKILAEIKDDQVIIYLQPESCCDLADKSREPIKLPLISLPVNTKGIRYF